jgi:hypothetical protein
MGVKSRRGRGGPIMSEAINAPPCKMNESGSLKHKTRIQIIIPAEVRKGKEGTGAMQSENNKSLDLGGCGRAGQSFTDSLLNGIHSVAVGLVNPFNLINPASQGPQQPQHSIWVRLDIASKKNDS